MLCCLRRRRIRADYTNDCSERPESAKTARNPSAGDGFKPFSAASSSTAKRACDYTRWPEVKTFETCSSRASTRATREERLANSAASRSLESCPGRLRSLRKKRQVPRTRRPTGLDGTSLSATELAVKHVSMLPGAQQWSLQPSPRQHSRPSLTASPATTKAASGSSHQNRKRVLPRRPISTAPARYAQGCSAFPPPAVAAESSREPSFSFARPSSGIRIRLLTLRPIPR
jgi:hypothetical protein